MPESSANPTRRPAGRAVASVAWDSVGCTDLPGVAHILTRCGVHWTGIGTSVFSVEIAPLELSARFSPGRAKLSLATRRALSILPLRCRWDRTQRRDGLTRGDPLSFQWTAIAEGFRSAEFDRGAA